MIFSLSFKTATTTMIWPTTDRIPHSLIFKRMRIKRIADNIRAFSFSLTNWNKEPDEERIYRWTEFFHKLDNNKWKMRTGARARKQKYISIYISLYMKNFLKTGVYSAMYIYIYIYTRGYWQNPSQVCIILESVPNFRQVLIGFMVIPRLYQTPHIEYRSGEIQENYFLLALIKGGILTNGNAL